VPEFEPLPLRAAELERFRWRCRQQLRPGLVGSHLTRRKGQSLEFRELVAYTPGDDLRYVDWQASARTGDEDALLVRSFLAEEQMTLVVSLDTRDSLWLPRALPKRQVAAWLAEAIATLVLRGRAGSDRVILHRLFGASANSLVELHGAAQAGQVRSVLQRLAATPSDEVPNLAHLIPKLPPAAVWMIVTDLYFSDPGAVLARQAAAASRGARWVIVVDLNSWPYEAGLAERERSGLIAGPQLERPVPFDQQVLSTAREASTQHKQRWLASAGRSKADIVWDWPVSLPSAALGREFFRHRFWHEPIIQQLFMRDA